MNRGKIQIREAGESALVGSPGASASRDTSKPTKVPETMLCYVEKGKHHLPGPNPGTPFTVCGLDAGDMQRDEHPISHAALWCTDCMRTHLGYE